MNFGILEEDAGASKFTKKTVPDGVEYDDLKDQIDWGIIEVRPSKRSRGTTASPDDAVHQFSNILVETLETFLFGVTASAGGVSSAGLQPPDADALLQRFEGVAAILQELEERRRATSCGRRLL
jgi:hypothetical protein